MNIQTILLLFFSFLFTGIGGFLALYGQSADDKNLGYGSIGLFGIWFLTFAFFGWRRSIFQRKIIEDATKVSIEGGRKFKIEKSKYYIVSIILISLGVFLSYFIRINLVFTISFFILSTIGLIMLLGVLFGFFARDYLIFEADGIRVGLKKYFYIIRWDNVMKVTSGELRNHVAVFINLISPEDTTRYLYVKKGRRDRTIKKVYSIIRRNLNITNYHLVILPERFGLDAGHFYRMLEGYLKYPEKRIELKKLG